MLTPQAVALPRGLLRGAPAPQRLRPPHVQAGKQRVRTEIVEASTARFSINVESILQPGRKIFLKTPRDRSLDPMLMVNDAQRQTVGEILLAKIRIRKQ